MKKYVVLLLSMLLVLAVSGCGAQNTEETPLQPIHVGLLTDGGGIDDGGVNQLAWEGLQALQRENAGVQLSYLVYGKDGTYAECIDDLAGQGCSLVICTDGTMAEAIGRVAAVFPDVRFAVLNAEEIALPNVTCLKFALEQAAYLAGVAAAKTTESDLIGCIHGRMTAETEQLVAAYMAGARAANSSVRVLRSNILGDGDGGDRAAEEMVAKGVDVIFHADGESGSAVIRACDRNGIWAIGTQSGHVDQGVERLLATAAKCVDAAVQNVVKAAATGQLESGIRMYDLSNQGVDLANPQGHLSETVLTSVGNYRTKLKAGEIQILRSLEELETEE